MIELETTGLTLGVNVEVVVHSRIIARAHYLLEGDILGGRFETLRLVIKLFIAEGCVAIEQRCFFSTFLVQIIIGVSESRVVIAVGALHCSQRIYILAVTFIKGSFLDHFLFSHILNCIADRQTEHQNERNISYVTQHGYYLCLNRAPNG